MRNRKHIATKNTEASGASSSTGLLDAESPVHFSEPDRYLNVWMDRAPDEPHMPHSGVMRWDLRQNDWWKIWPDLMAHPCAYLFAPQHPNREGPPRFADWVASWPAGFDWERRLPPHLHDHVRKTLAALPQTPISSTVEVGGSAVRYAAPDNAQKALPIDRSIEIDSMLRGLIKTLLGVSEEERENTARLLSTLALAPDSARTLEALKASISKPHVAA